VKTPLCLLNSKTQELEEDELKGGLCRESNNLLIQIEKRKKKDLITSVYREVIFNSEDWQQIKGLDTQQASLVLY
jgi:hypothetical protein